MQGGGRERKQRQNCSPYSTSFPFLLFLIPPTPPKVKKISSLWPHVEHNLPKGSEEGKGMVIYLGFFGEKTLILP